MFDAQTLLVAVVKQAVEGNDAQSKSVSPPSHRIADQKLDLQEFHSKGHMSVPFRAMTLHEMLEKDTPSRHFVDKRRKSDPDSKPTLFGSAVVSASAQQIRCSCQLLLCTSNIGSLLLLSHAVVVFSSQAAADL